MPRPTRRSLLAGALTLLLACGDDAPPDCPPPANQGECSRHADCCATEPCADLCVRAAPSADDGDATLRCAAPLGAAAGGEPCALPGDCRSGLCLIGGVCAAPCATDADCDDDARCEPRWTRADGGGHERATSCARRASVPPIARALSPVTRELALAPAPRAAHQVLLPRCGRLPSPTSLRGSEILFDLERLAPGAAPPLNPVYAAFPGPVTVVLPNGPAYEGWDQPHTIAFDEASSFEHLVFAPGTGTTLDVDLFLVGVAEPPAADLEPVRTMLASAGITLGAIRVHPLGGALASRLSILDGVRGELPELAELFGLGAGLPPSVPVFAVRHIDYFLGLAGGNPGPLATPGAPAAGVVIGAEDAGDRFGLVLAHELAHFLGLFHLTEPDGTVREPLPTTPICPLTADGDGDGLLSAEECTGQGAENLLFWSTERVTSPELDPEQGSVLRSAPILR